MQHTFLTAREFSETRAVVTLIMRRPLATKPLAGYLLGMYLRLKDESDLDGTWDRVVLVPLEPRVLLRESRSLKSTSIAAPFPTHHHAVCSEALVRCAP